MRYIGVDLHSNSITVCYLSESRQETLKTYSLGSLAEFRKSEVEVDVIVGQLRSVNEGIKQLEAQMAESGARLKGHANLVSIKRIGPKAASIEI